MTAAMGIDPGVNGGISVVDSRRNVLFCQPLKRNMTQKEVVAVVKLGAIALTTAGGKACFIEKVGYMPNDGGQGANTFGRVDGLLRGAAHAFGLTVKDVAPLMWQARLECLTGGNKNISKHRAIQLFRDRVPRITHSTADSLLIAEYGLQLLETDDVRSFL